MFKPKHIIIFPFVLILFLSNKCEKGGVVVEKELPFTVSEAYSQKMIPGVEGMKPYSELHLSLKNTPDNISFDSIYFQKNKIPISVFKRDKEMFITAKVENEGEVLLTPLTEGLKSNQAVIIGVKSENKKYFFIDSIAEKETLYLP
jgi:hypothetical protein